VSISDVVGELSYAVVRVGRLIQEGWLSPTSVSAYFGLPEYTRHGTIAVNVTWMKRGYNVGQTHRSMYPSIFNHLRAIARYCNFFLPLAFNASVGGVPIGIPGKSLVLRKLESWV